MKTFCTISLVVLALLAGFILGITFFKSADLNHDGKVDVLDFSIMMNQWTK